MARDVLNVSVEPEVTKSLDEFSEMLGVSRSAAVNMILKAALDVDRKALTTAMTDVLLGKGKKEAAQAVDAAING